MPDGRSDVRKLSRRSPMIVGRNPISDVRIDDDSVAPIHCRLSWNGTAFEVAAVAADGVDVNGVLVRRKELTDGDVIRVGGTDLVVVARSSEPPPASEASPVVRHEANRALAPRRAGTFEEAKDLPADEIEFPVQQPEVPFTKSVRSAVPKGDPAGEPLVLLESPPEQPSHATAAPAGGTAEPPAGVGKTQKTTLQPHRKRLRPGEQDVLTSPLVLGLGGFAFVLLLTAGAIWFLIGREGADKLYKSASADHEAGRYAQAITEYEQFLAEYPRDSRAADARFELGRVQVERYAVGGSPDWDKALTEFDRFATASRADRGFAQHRGVFGKLAETIASGAAAAATRAGDRKPLAAAEQGRKLFDRFSPAGPESDAVRARLASAYDAALAAVRKKEYFDDAAKRIDAAIGKNDFATVYENRTNLLTRYPDLASNKRVQTLLTKALDAERKLVRSDAEPEVTSESARGTDSSRPPVTLIGHTQARAGEVSNGRLVFAVARGALFGLDAVTGRPVWRHPIGLDTPFFPIEVDASVPALLVFDTGRNELVLVGRADGKPVWRTAVDAAASGPPLVTQGQIDLATAGGRLVRFALESGERLASVSFPQPVVGPPVVSGERLVLFGDRATAYTLGLRSLEVHSISFTGHAAGAIDAAPSALGRLVVACENDRLDSAVLRAFSVDPETGNLKQVAAERIDGQVRQPAVARGNLLFVPSSPERITAFSVTDDAGQPPLSRLAGVQIPDAREVPVFLVSGAEGMLWEAGSALRKLRLTADGLKLLDGVLAPGRHTQPPQQSGESLFVARSLASSPAVYVSQADREAMTGSWRTVLGGSILAATAGGQAVTFVTDAGQTAIVTAGEIATGGFTDTKPLPQLDEGAPEPLAAVTCSDGRAAVWRGGKAPALWLIRPGSQPAPPRPLSGAPECPPLALDAGIVLPVSGRLDWISESNTRVDAFLLPVGGEGQTPPRWRSLARLDAERLAALDETDTLRVVRVRREPLPHLAEIASVQFDAPPTRPLAAAGDQILSATDRRLRLIDSAGLRPVAEALFDATITGGPWFIEATVFIQIESGELIALDAEGLTERWRVRLDAPAAGPPLADGPRWIAASRAGTVLDIGPDGKESPRAALAEPVTALFRIGETVAAAGLDGSLHSIEVMDRSPSETTAEVRR